ncbi:unnamed protein product [Closterium sp. NIES-54]
MLRSSARSSGLSSVTIVGSAASRRLSADLIKRAFLTCGISNALDGSEDGLAMAHWRSQLTAEVDVDDSIIVNGFFGNNCQEPESDEEDPQPHAASSRACTARVPACAARCLSQSPHAALSRTQLAAKRALLVCLPAQPATALAHCCLARCLSPLLPAAHRHLASSRACPACVPVSAEGDCYLCVPPDPGIAPGIALAALGACESAPLGTAPAQALHTLTLDSCASRCIFRDSTTVTPLPAPVPVSLADPSGGPVLAWSSTVLPCPVVPSGELSGLHLPSFSTNLTGRHLATFTRAPGSSLYTLTTASRSAPLSPELHASAQVATQCECRRLSHDTLLWHHRLGHPSLPRLRSMHSRFLVSGLPRSLPALPPSPAPPCIPCVEGRQRAAPHSSSFPPTEAPLQTLHLDVWAPARVRGQSHERYFLLVVDDYTRYTKVFPLQRKGDVPTVLIPWIRAARLQLHERFHSDFPVLRLHSDRGVMEVTRTSMIHAAAPHFLWPSAVRYAAHQLKLWPRVSLPETSPTLLWTGKVGDASRFKVWGARAFVRDPTADKLSPRAIPCVDPPPPAPVEVTGDSGPAGSGAVPGGAELGGAESGGVEREEAGGAASGGAEPACVEPRGAESGGESPEGSETAFPRSPWSSHLRPRVPLTSQQLHNWYGRRQRRASAPQGSTAGGSSAGVAGPGGAHTKGTGAAGAGGVVTEGTGATEGAGAAGGTGAAGGAGGAGAFEGTGATSSAGAAEGTGAAGGAGPAEGPGATGGAGAAEGTGAAGGAGAAGVAGGARAAGAGGTAQPRLFFAPPSPSSQQPPDSALRQVLSLPSSTGLPLQPGSPLLAPSPYTEQTGGLAERREPASRPVSPVRSSRSGRRVPRQRQPAVSGPHLVVRRPSSPPLRVPLPSPPASSLPVVADPASDQFRAEHSTVTRLLATVVTDISFESAAASALVAELVDFAAACRVDYAASLVAESDSVCPPSIGDECALGTDVLEDKQEDLKCLAATAPHLVAMLLAPEGDPDAPDIPTPRSYAEAITGEYSSQWQTAMDIEMASWKSTGTYVDEVPPPGAIIVSGMWIFRVKRPPRSPPVFKARYVARDFSQREGVDFFQTFSPTPKMTTLRVLLHVAAQRDYELHSLDFSTAFLQGSLHEEIWLRRPPSFTGSFPPGTQWSLRRPVYGLRQAPREWHDTLRTTLAALGFALSTADPSLFLRTDTLLPPFYILVYVDDLVFATADTEALALVKSELQKRHTCTDLGELRSYLGLQITRDRARRTITLAQSHMVQQVLQRFGFTWSSAQATPLATGHSLSAPPSDKSVEPSGPDPELVGCLMYLMTCTRPDLACPLGLLARYVAPGRHRKVHMDAAKRVLRYLCSTSGMGLVLGGRGDVVLTGHSDASWVDDQATQRSSQGYTFSLGSILVSWRSTRSSSVLGSSCEAEIYATAMAAQELRWLTYLLTDLGERPRSPPVLLCGDVVIHPELALHFLPGLQLQALFSLLQQQAPGTIATSTDYNSASVKTEKQKEAVATRTTKVARATTAVPAPALPTEPVQVPAIEDNDNSDNDDGEAPDNLARHRILAPAPPLPPLNPSPAATTFMRKGVRDKAEVFSAIQAHLRHVEFKLRNGDVEGALSNVAQVETLINKRFEVLLVADEAGFEAADRFQLYQAKSVLTSRSYKLAVADVAALKRARTGFARGGRLPARDGKPESKGMPPVGCHEPRFKGVCFRCGQPRHMANNCPMGGRGAQGPAPVV